MQALTEAICWREICWEFSRHSRGFAEKQNASVRVISEQVDLSDSRRAHTDACTIRLFSSILAAIRVDLCTFCQY